jgi:hypothetical protein
MELLSVALSGSFLTPFQVMVAGCLSCALRAIGDDHASVAQQSSITAPKPILKEVFIYTVFK